MIEHRPDLGRAARWYAEKAGWPVAPAHWIKSDGSCSCNNPKCSSPGKHPITGNGFKDATTDLTAIQQWWSQHPDANLILPTGEATGVLVLDVDPDHGGDAALTALEAEHGPLPATLEQTTGSGGRHLLFKHPGPEYRNTASKAGPGLDTQTGKRVTGAPCKRTRCGSFGNGPARPIGSAGKGQTSLECIPPSPPCGWTVWGSCRC